MSAHGVPVTRYHSKGKRFKTQTPRKHEADPATNRAMGRRGTHRRKFLERGRAQTRVASSSGAAIEVRHRPVAAGTAKRMGSASARGSNERSVGSDRPDRRRG